MRFKFRAWDKEKNVLMSVKLMDFSEWWVSCNPIGVNEPLAFGERNSFNNEQTDRHILMQYTGFKDKNGKEIYEGDIVRYQQRNLEKAFGMSSGDDFEVKTRKIVYSCQSFNVPVGFIKDLEVVGNIYEK